MATKRSYWERLGTLSYGVNRVRSGFGAYVDADREYIAAMREMTRR